jgi:NAD(P)-dependent dehydrogenase (short-subunit alcohol dehydrogenase family)
VNYISTHQIRPFQTELPSIFELREYFFKGITKQRNDLLATVPSGAVKGTFIITGASNGIGADCALIALRDGYSVIAIDKTPFDVKGELPINRCSSDVCDITVPWSLQDALTRTISEADAKNILGNDIYLVCSAGVYSATDAQLCMKVNYHGTRNTIEQIQENFKDTVRGITIVGSDQSYFDKNSQRNYGVKSSSDQAPYMFSKQATRRYFEELYADRPKSWTPCLIAPSTVITPLTAAVFSEVEPSVNPRQFVFENWERENRDIPDGLLHPLHLAYVIVNVTVRKRYRVSNQLIECIESGRGVLLDGGLNQREGIIRLSDRFTRFSLTRADSLPVTQMMNFD